ncbi:MAG: hypothetical protein SH850_29550, partial [Planctomycetaceae bacterium]|nr:hypothetical protein [Planctomycetaceae bacterium]
MSTTLFLITAMTLTAAHPAAEVVIAGATLAEWRERMSVIDPADPQSARWVPGLIAVVEAESVPWFTRRQAALTLGRMRATARDAVPVLRRLLDDVGDDPETSPQLWALKSLSLFGPVAKDAAPEAVRLLQSKTTPALSRLTAIDVLSQTGPAHPIVIPTLIAFAGDASEPTLRRTAIEALGLNGPAA